MLPKARQEVMAMWMVLGVLAVLLALLAFCVLPFLFAWLARTLTRWLTGRD